MQNNPKMLRTAIFSVLIGLGLLYINASYKPLSAEMLAGPIVLAQAQWRHPYYDRHESPNYDPERSFRNQEGHPDDYRVNNPRFSYDPYEGYTPRYDPRSQYRHDPNNRYFGYAPYGGGNYEHMSPGYKPKYSEDHIPYEQDWRYRKQR